MVEQVWLFSGIAFFLWQTIDDIRCNSFSWANIFRNFLLSVFGFFAITAKIFIVLGLDKYMKL